MTHSITCLKWMFLWILSFAALMKCLHTYTHGYLDEQTFCEHLNELIGNCVATNSKVFEFFMGFQKTCFTAGFIALIARIKMNFWMHFLFMHIEMAFLSKILSTFIAYIWSVVFMIGYFVVIQKA